MRILSLLILLGNLLFSNQKTESPHGPDFKVSCKTCHSPSGWQLDMKVYSFDHNTTRLPLTGEHKTVGCKECHPTLKFAQAKINCNECHTDIHQGTTDPDCSRCHTPSSWLVNNIIEVHQFSRFPLVGVHRTADCSLCHQSASAERYDVAGVNCIDCHRKDYLATTKPNHIQSGIGEDCLLCHPLNSVQWSSTGFDHAVFPLTLGHAAIKCTDCHLTGSFKGTNAECSSCHEKDFLATTSPNHSASGISEICQNCHTTTPGWKPVIFNHNSFPLTLGHSVPLCSDCHKGGNYSTTPIDCYSCHQADFLAAVSPNHTSAGFSKICQTCHSINPGWKPTTFVHTGISLTLGHSSVNCIDCHTGGNYTTLSTACYSCHQNDFNATTNPNHITAGISQVCQTCHTLIPGWKPALYNHATFPLTQGHSTPLCADCHKGGNYTTTSAICYSCHQADYAATTNPNHSSVGYPTTCNTCHTLVPEWKPAVFAHTALPLTLGHAIPACIDCHKGGNYITIPTDCYSCHLIDYTSATNPNHVTSGIPTTCTTCHTTAPGWTPATFSHTTFPLTLGHASPTCADCHKGNFTTTSTVCYSCHAADYNNSVNPNHKTLAFATTCNTCHTTVPGWAPATYTQHDVQMFPIYSGRHQGRWTL